MFTLLFLLLVCSNRSKLMAYENNSGCWKSISFGIKNTDEWKRLLKLEAVRSSCSGEPLECLATRMDVESGWLKGYGEVYLVANRPGDRVAGDFLIYSKESLMYPNLKEVGFDDFYDYWKNVLKNNNNLLTTIVNNLKKHNSSLGFGITLYDDQIDFMSQLTKSNREKVDYVHLYNHYRVSAIEKNVEKIKTLFPNAKIFLGVYALDYKSPCKMGEKESCFGTEEYQYFLSSLEEQLELMNNCQTEAIEFWPAYFGNEQLIDFDYCLKKGNEKDECLSNTLKMRLVLAEKVSKMRGVSLPDLIRANGGDFNMDGKVNVIDYSIWFSGFNSGRLSVLDYSVWYQGFVDRG